MRIYGYQSDLFLFFKCKKAENIGRRQPYLQVILNILDKLFDPNVLYIQQAILDWNPYLSFQIALIYTNAYPLDINMQI